jgi:hypothetical protein
MLDNYGYKHTECLIFIAFPRHQFLRERLSVLRCTLSETKTKRPEWNRASTCLAISEHK